MTSLAAVVDELYGLAPDDFTAARDAASRRARNDGDRELAAAVKSLRRPSASAWLVNQVARAHADRLGELLDLGEQLRAAQDALQGDELRALSRRRHEVVGALAGLAAEAAAQSGRRVADAVRREIEATLDAALADEQAAEAVRSGHLMRALSSTGLEAVDLTDAVAADLAPAPRSRSGKQAATRTGAAKAAPSKRAGPSRASAERAESSRGAAQRGQREVREARAALDRAEADLAAQDESVRAAQSAVDEAREQVAGLEAKLSDARHRARAAERQRRDAEQSRRTALRAREAAARALQAAERRAGS
ncbi:MAG TPA: hypothetical protein VH395_12190 [Jatrophihabitantaceae bacterium]|jgi:hypothetical protein